MIRVEQLSLRAGEFWLRDISFRIASGEFFVLMGPTGSGKSLLVKCICGLARPTTGRIFIDQKDVTRLEPRRRKVGYVPQDGGLFPHMNVIDNITFSLRVKGASREDAIRRASPIIDILALSPMLQRSTSTLSGGERQKVAVARALAGEPNLLILDEPVSSLDEPTRREVCVELKRIQRQLKVPTIHICHSIVEARALSDRVGILEKGRLVQTGTLEEILKDPADAAVSRLLNVEAADSSAAAEPR